MTSNSRPKQDLALHAYLQQSLEARPVRDPPQTHRHIPAVPDLRFEYSYLRSIARYVHVERSKPDEVVVDRKGKGRAVEASQLEMVESFPGEVVQVQWARVLWITARDQALMPLLQGVIWGVVGPFVGPAMAVASARFSEWWGRGAGRRAGAPSHEGGGVGWLRDWIAGLTTPSITTPHGITFTR